jgi:hypothetical protein
MKIFFETYETGFILNYYCAVDVFSKYGFDTRFSDEGKFKLYNLLKEQFSSIYCANIETKKHTWIPKRDLKNYLIFKFRDVADDAAFTMWSQKRVIEI